MKYRLIVNTSDVTQADTVEDYLGKGWILFGPPFSKGQEFVQALIKYSEEEINAMYAETPTMTNFTPIDRKSMN